MYQSPPSVPVWTRRHWIAAIGAGAAGSALALAIITIGGGIVSAGGRGILIGSGQALFMTWLTPHARPQQPARAKNTRVIIIAVAMCVAIFAYMASKDLSDGRIIGDRISMMLGIFGGLTGPMLVWGRFRRKIEQGG